MKILVINVSLRPQSQEKIFPMGLGYITTAMKNAGFNFDLLDIDCHRYSDEYVENFIRHNNYDVVCMGCIVTGYKIVKRLADLIKGFHPKTTIIAGNSVAASIIKTILIRTKVDIAVIGEGDQTIVELLTALSSGSPIDNIAGIAFCRDGQIIQASPRQIIKDISRLPSIDYSIFDVESYIESSKVSVSEPLMVPREKIRALPVNTARGCIANCGFCYHVFKGLPYRCRSADSIVSEIKSMTERYNLNYIFFWDELTFFSKRQTLEFAEKIIDERMCFFWAANCRSGLFDSEDDLSLLKKLKEAGCVGMGYSLESADKEILKSMNKYTTVEQFSRQTELLHKAGLAVWTSLVFGYPQETPESIKKTFDCCIENRIYPSAGYLLPQPGSQIYDYALNRRLINDEEDYLMIMGDRQDLRLNMTSMPDDEFQRHICEGLKRCNDILQLGLDENSLLKTLCYRGKK